MLCIEERWLTIVKEGFNVRGLFLTVEGVEGSGKTTVTKSLAEWLRQKGLTVIVTAEPVELLSERTSVSCWQISAKELNGLKRSSSSQTEPNMWRR